MHTSPDAEEPLGAKARFTILIPFLGALAALGPLSNDLYVPSLSLVAAGLGVDGGAVQLTMSALLIGFSLGALIYGPVSDCFGRKPVLLFGLAVYIIAAASSTLADNLAMLVALRVLQGLGAAAGMVLSRAIILDRWRGEEASRALSWVSIFTFLTPVIAPVVGGYVASLGHWPAVFWVHATAGAVCFAVTATMLERLRKGAATSVLAGVRAYAVILKDAQALGYMLCTGTAFIGLIAFVSNSSFVFIEHFGLEPHEYGYCFSFVMLGASIGAFVNGHYVARLGIARMLGFGTSVLAAGGALTLLAVLVDGGLASLLLGIMVYVFGIGFVFANAIARTMSRFPRNTGAASALFGVNQFLIGALVAAGLSLSDEPSPHLLAIAMAAAGAACALVWWLWLRRAV